MCSDQSERQHLGPFLPRDCWEEPLEQTCNAGVNQRQPVSRGPAEVRVEAMVHGRNSSDRHLDHCHPIAARHINFTQLTEWLPDADATSVADAESRL